jgi:RNA polymerase sigma factor (sigma-70 family)
METTSDGSVTVCFREFRLGDAAAAEELWRRFHKRLVGLAATTLKGWPTQIADADDAAQSAFVSFWRKAGRGELDGDLHRENIWNVLGVIAVRKAYRQIEREAAQKRGGGRTRHESSAAAPALDQLPDRDWPCDLDIHCEELLLKLDEPLRQIALWRLLGHTNREIAGRLGCTERRIQRKLQLIRMRWQRDVDT